jgi:hypothetical protein
MNENEDEPRFEIDPPGGSLPATPQPAPATPDAAAAFPNTASDQESAGRQLAQQMQALGYHPVVIFGSTSSGKTTLLGSLLSYIQKDHDAGAEISLGEEFSIAGSEYGSWAHEKAAAFFFRGVQEHINERTQAATRTQYPFFIPVILKPRGGLPEVKIALLESNGEWYNAETGSDRFFQKLRDEIAGLLHNYGDGVSFLHLAPVTQLEQYRQGVEGDRSKDEALRHAADLALVGCFNAYRDIRPVKNNDRHLLLLTKWDAHAKPMDPRDNFFAPSLAEVKDIARQKYPQAYVAFVNLSLGDTDATAKQIMQYCSGIISGREVLRQSAEVDMQIRRYPRALWNWIYRGALHDPREQRLLYSEPKPAEPSLIQRLHAKLLRLLGV